METTRTEFLKHISDMFDGTTSEPCTYVSADPVRGNRSDLGGQIISNEHFETFTSKRLEDGRVAIDMLSSGAVYTAFERDKQDTLESLSNLFDRYERENTEVHYYIGAEHNREPSLWFYGP